MNITKEQAKELGQLALPLMYWLKRNCHPHCDIQIDSERVILTEVIAGIPMTAIVQEQSIKEEKPQ